MKRLRGLVAAAFTPMCEDGSLRLERVGAIVEHLLGQRLSGIFLCGSTGEGESLTAAERRLVAEAYMEAVGGRLPVIVQVGHNCLREARDLAEHAQRIGVAAISATPPSYFPLSDLEVVVDGLARIAEGAPDTPLYYYHIPRITGVPVDVLRMVELAADRLPTLAGIKYSEPSLDGLVRCVAEQGTRYDFLFGSDEMLLGGIATGAHGAVGSTYNFLGPLYAGIIEAVARGDLDAARAGQLRATRIVHAILSQPAMPALKASMALAGVDCGPTRLPLRPLNAAQREALERDLRAAVFFAEVGTS